MAVIQKNPDLPDYFTIVDDVSIDTPVSAIRSFVPEYERGEILYFPNLKFAIDHDFWAKIPADQFASLKKLTCYIDEADQDTHIQKALRKVADAPADLRDALAREMASLFRQVMPIYRRVFAGYRFSSERAIWRLNTITAENMHFDTYREELPEHFARMFINLDNQPRIWQTSYTVEQISQRFGRDVPAKKLATVDTNRFWRELQIAAFGSGHSFDRAPRHMIFFDPGDVWVVDSRQIAHQIFYGRRAISIDFVVTLDSMADADKHYLRLAERFRERLTPVTV